jgi:hypothetical protein
VDKEKPCKGKKVRGLNSAAVRRTTVQVTNYRFGVVR